jgi:hypothetical protein
MFGVGVPVREPGTTRRISQSTITIRLTPEMVFEMAGVVTNPA